MIVQVTNHVDNSQSRSGPRDVSRTTYYDKAYDVQFSNERVWIDPKDFDFNDIWPGDCGHIHLIDADETGEKVAWVRWYDDKGCHILITNGSAFILNDDGKTINRVR